MGSDVLTHIYNPTYSVGTYQEDYRLRPAQAKNSLDPTSTNKLSVVVCAYCSSGIV
jgi:hypothetical protein